MCRRPGVNGRRRFLRTIGVACIAAVGAPLGCGRGSRLDDRQAAKTDERTGPLIAAARNAVAVHVSETTAQLWRYTSWRNWHSAAFVTEALRSDGTPYETVSDADIASGRLMTGTSPTYPILISLNNEAISDAVAGQIEAYVSNGGRVYVGGSSWTKTETGALRPDFALADAMGLLSRGNWTRTHDVQRVGTSAMIDQMPMSTPKWWFLPSSFDITRAGDTAVADFDPDYHYTRTIHETSHWYWAAELSTGAAATPLLQPYLQHLDTWDASALPADPFAPDLPPPGLSESIYASSWTADSDVQIADVNGDGRADLVGRNRSTGDVQVGLSTGQGFALSTSWRSWNTAYTFQLADVDGDGCADIVGRPKAGGDEVQVGISDGCSGGAVFRDSTEWAHWPQTLSLQLADVDADHGADIVGRALSGSEDVMVALSDKTNGFGAAERWTTWRQNTTLQLADVDADGAADLVGRLIGGNDVQVGLSNGGSGQHSFQSSTSWTTWGQPYSVGLADFDGDHAADIFGLDTANGATSSVAVGLSQAQQGTRAFAPSPEWQHWPTSGIQHATTALNDGQFVGDVNGDGRADLIGRKGTAIVMWLSLGTQATPTHVLLTTKDFGLGRFIYNAAMQPLAGYGGDAKAGQEYKTLRVAIDEAFTARDQALVRLAAWPFPARAAFIYRHDHVLNNQIVDREQQMGINGEYYIEPDIRNVTSCGFSASSNATDYPTGVSYAVANGAIIGSHQLYHAFPDEFGEADAQTQLMQTLDAIQCDTGQRPSNFVAPGYLGILSSSLRAESEVPFFTAGEIGYSPFPAYSLDPDLSGQLVDALIQLPVTGIIYQQSWRDVCAGTDVAYDTNGLINTYDHGGVDTAGAGADRLINGSIMAGGYLSWLFNGAALPDPQCATRDRPDILKTTSGAIAQWWIDRDRKALAITTTSTSTTADISVTMSLRSARPASPSTLFPRPPPAAPFTDDNLALRIDLSPLLLSFAHAGVSVTLDGIAAPATTALQDGPHGTQLAVKIGTATTIQIHLGL